MQGCSTFVVIICPLPLESATPFSTVLLDSLPHEVNIISSGSAFIFLAMISLELSKASFASLPN